MESSIPEDLPPTLWGDPGRLRQILLNLLGNAVKFTEQGGICLRVHCQRIQYFPRYTLTFQIQDTGIGITESQLDRLFQPFSQGDSSISRRYGGTGLGLSISQRLVELMGGTLWVESRGKVAGQPPPEWQPPIDTSTSRGSTFYFTIVLEAFASVREPLVVNTPAPIPPNSDFARHYPLEILLADDNPVNRKVVQFTCDRLGYTIDTVNNGQEALEAVTQKAYDLVFMDLQMPEMDGLTATAAIRKAPLKHQPCIIALTSNALTQDIQSCLDAGMDGYQTKPLKIETIQEICRTLKLHY